MERVRRLRKQGYGLYLRATRLLARLRYRDPVLPVAELAAGLVAASRWAAPPLLAEMVAANIATHGAERVVDAASAAMEQLAREQRARARRTLFQAVFGALDTSDVRAAAKFGDAWIDGIRDRATAQRLARLLVKQGAIARPLELLKRHGDRRTQPLLDRVEEQARLLREGHVAQPGARRPVQPASDRRVLYCASHALSLHPNGYSIRTHSIVRQLAAHGWDMTVATRFGYPDDRIDFPDKIRDPRTDQVDGIPYVVRPDPIGHRDSHPAYMQRAAHALATHAAQLRPALLHAASNYQVGLAAVTAARTIGLPVIYEVRGLWHVTRTSYDAPYADSEHYRLVDRLEVDVARAADHVLAISGAVADFLTEHGVERGRMSILPNAVDLDEFTPRDRDVSLARELGLDGKIVVGMIGSMKPYEGIDLLLRAVASLRRGTGDLRVLLVGDGPEVPELTALARELGIADSVLMPGRVPHDRVAAYYSLLDVAVYPRTDTRLCHLVPPLKPFEAMAMGRAVLVSDVKAMAEMVEHGRTGLVHAADDVSSLATQLSRLIDSASLRAELGEAARAWVVAHRSWDQVVRVIEDVYVMLVGRTPAAKVVPIPRPRPA